MNKILVLGYFGYNTNQLDGQTVKTRDIYKLIQGQCNEFVDFYDTEDFQFSKLSIIKMYWKIICCNKLIYLPAHNNLKAMFPSIFCHFILLRFKIQYFVVGGWLREFLEDKSVHRYMLSKIDGIHVETQRLKNELEEYYHFTNVDVFPNFRFFDFYPVKNENKKLRLVFMARVNKMKGLDWIFNLADYISKHQLEDKFTLTFFGPIHEEDKHYFITELAKYSFAEYKGALQPDIIHETLNQYDVMLLPTHYYTEGLPGSIVDAYISGIPVIATEWKHSHEFVDDEYSGYIIPFENGEDELIKIIMNLESDRILLSSLKENVLKKRNEFAPPLISWLLND